VLLLTVAVVTVGLVRIPVVTVGKVCEATVKLCVSVEPFPLLVSVSVSVPLAEPHVRVAVAEVFELTVIVPRLAPVPPLSVNRPLED
jgi:hypothetical protein